MKKLILDYINKMEGWKTAIKSLHWDADNLSQHRLCDDIAGAIADFQDQVSEVEQAISGNLSINTLKGVPYKIKDLKTFIQDVLKDTNVFYKKVKKLGDDYVGMASDCESFLSDMQRKLYLANFTLKEDLKRRLKNRINESRKEYVIESKDADYTLTESEFKHLLRSSVHKEQTYYLEIINKRKRIELLSQSFFAFLPVIFFLVLPNSIYCNELPTTIPFHLFISCNHPQDFYWIIGFCQLTLFHLSFFCKVTNFISKNQLFIIY